MTDIFGSEPILPTTESILPDPLGLDASSLDMNLRAIRQVEQSWRLPALPDSVRLDLASQGMDTGGVSRFLRNLESDIFGENPEDQDDPALSLPSAGPALRVASTQPFGPVAQTGFEEASNLISSLRNLPPAEKFDPNAAQRWKMRAIEEGFMKAPDDGVIDATWSPELTQIQKEMQYAQYNDRMRGNRVGAVSASTFMDTLNEWTSPTGLFRHAVDLDLFWDVEQVGKEFSSWGDKWAKVGKSDGAIEFGRNLFDAMTGPIDDIVVPALNLALLFSGVGAGTNFARLGMTGLRGAGAAAAVGEATKLYQVPRLLRPLTAVSERIFPGLRTADEAQAAVRGLAQPSWMAQRLQSKTGLAKGAGDAMAAWREIPAVIASKRVLQTGMRLGVAHKVESLLPSYQAHSLGDIDPVKEAVDRAFGNDWVRGLSQVTDVVLAPYTMFEPGTFTSGAKTLGAAGFKFLGSRTGRAAVGATVGGLASTDEDTDTGEFLTGMAAGAGIGAFLPDAGKVLSNVPGAKKVGHFLRGMSWAPLGEDQRLTSMFYTAMRSKLEPEQFQAFDESVRNKGFIKAFGEHHGLDDESTGAAMYFVALSASIDRTAALQAGAVGSDGWRERYLLARNKLTAQIRSFGPDATREDVIHAIVSKEGPGRRNYKRRFDSYVNGVDVNTGRPLLADEDLAEAISKHNEQASMTLKQLMSPANLPVDGFDQVDDVAARSSAMTDYIANALDTFGDWNKYQPATSQLGRFIDDGVMDDIPFLAPRTFRIDGGTGRKLNILEHMEEYSPELDESLVEGWSSHIHDMMFLDKGVTQEQYRLAGGYYNPLAREVDPTRSRMTLARRETATKQELIETADELGQVERVLKDWQRVVGFQQRLTPGTLDLGELHHLTNDQVEQLVVAIGKKGSMDAAALRRLHRFTSSRGVSVDDAFQTTVARLAEEVTSDARWTERFGLPGRMMDDENRILSGMDLLKARKKQVLAKARTTAAELDGRALVNKLREQGKVKEADDFAAYLDHVESQGYKLVYGADFLMPDELLHKSHIFQDIGDRHLNAMTLGNFFGRSQPEELSRNVRRVRNLSLAKELGRATGTELGPEDDLVKRATSDLTQILDEELVRNRALTDDIAHQAWLSKRASAIRNSDVPTSLQSLGLGRNQKRVTTRLREFGWSEQEALAIWLGLKKGRFAEFQDLGLYAIEAKLRSQNQLVSALHVLGGTTEGSRLSRAKAGIVVGGGVGAYQGAQGEDKGLEGALLGGLAGAAIGGAGRLASSKVVAPVADAMDTKQWARYGYMADGLASLRDKMRFAMSPFFDISRYTEAYFLTHTAAPKGAGLPLNQSPSSLRKMFQREFEKSSFDGDARIAAQHKFQRVVEDFRNASNGRFDPDELESTGRWFTEVGILGFNPTNWMASTFHHLRETGMDSQKAFDTVKDMYTYGTKGRSAAEQSVNFVFFPFSFQKKALGHLGKWMSDDMTRAVLLHDAYKAFELLNENYDLSTWAEEHLPALEKLQQLNLFAFGISPGRLGGINAPYIDLLIGDPTSEDARRKGLILNLLSPQGADAGGPGVADTLKKAVQKTIPAINDINHMVEDLQSQGHVMFDPSHQVRWAQARDAYSEWNEYKTGVEAALAEKGATLRDMQTWGGYAPVLAQYERKKLELRKKYPGWDESKLRSQEKRARYDMEKELRLNTVRYQPDEASATDMAFFEFDTQLQELKEHLEFQGLGDWEDMPGVDFERVKALAVRYAEETPGFRMIYEKFYQQDFGPLTSKAY